MNLRSSMQVVLLVASVLLLSAGIFLSRPGGATDDLGWLALSLAIVVTAAVLGGHVAGRLGQPAVLGELVIGLLLGNAPGLEKLRFVAADPYVDILARIGMLLLMFEVGLDLSVRDLFAVGPSSLAVAFLGTIASFAFGTAAAALFLPSAPTSVHLFLGAAITATSVGITARVLKDIGASRSGEARVILGAAVVDDVLALVLLGIMTTALGASSIGLGTASIVGLIMKTVGFLVLAIVLGTRLTPIWFRQAARLRTNSALLAIGLCFCFILSWASSSIGLAPLVGAFAAGLVLEDAHSEEFVQRGERSLGELLQPMTAFLVPVFFVLVGFRANLRALADPRLLAFSAALTFAAVLGKLSCGLGVLQSGVRRLTVAAGMIPRGEVTLVFAALGSSLKLGGTPVLDDSTYTAIVGVVVLTTLATPPALKWAMKRSAAARDLTRPAA